MRILAATAIRDEGPFLLEWLAWHRLIGVTDFLIFSNDCTDGSDLLLDALAAQGVVEHRPNPARGGESLQWRALAAAWDHPLRRAADWMLISDVDEFPMIHAGRHRLADLFKALPAGTDAVALPWRLFGNAGVIGFADRSVTEQFRHSAPADMPYPVAATFFKSLFRPAAFAGPGIHRPQQAGAPRPVPCWVDGSGRPLATALAGDDRRLSLLLATGGRDLVEMHHYSLRSAESFIVKAARGLPNRSAKAIDLHYWVARNFNAVPNASAEALAAPLRHEIAALKALPDVAALHARACERHRDAFRRLVMQPAVCRLFCDCILAAQSVPLNRQLAAQLYALHRRVDGAGEKGAGQTGTGRGDQTGTKPPRAGS